MQYTLEIFTLTGNPVADYFFSLGIWFGVIVIPFAAICAIISRS